MADTTITVTFTEAQWTRIVAASSYIKGPSGSGNVDADFFKTMWKENLTNQVKAYEKDQASIADF